MYLNLKRIGEVFTKHEKNSLIKLFFLSLLMGISEMVGLGIIVPILNLFLDPEAALRIPFFAYSMQFIGINDAQMFLKILVIGGIVLFVFKMFYALFMRYYQGHVIYKINSRLADQVLRSYLNKPYSFHLHSNSALLFRNLTTEVNNFIGNYLNSIILIFVEVITIVAIISLLFATYPIPTLIALFFSFIVAFIAYFVVNERLKKASNERNIYSEAYYKNAMEGLQGIKEIKVNGVDHFFVNNFSQNFWDYCKSFINYSVLSAFPRYFIEAVVLIGFLLIMLFSALTNQNPTELIPVLATLAVAAVRVLPSIVTISQYLNMIQYYSNSAEIVYQIIQEDSFNVPKKEKKTIDKQNQLLFLQKIQFTYQNPEKTEPINPIFQDFSIKIVTHQTTALVGESGSGKSTLVDIIMGLLEPQNGQILYGETLINKENIESFRQKIGYVPQQIFLYDATLAENIAFGVTEKKIDYKKLEKAIELAQLTEVVKNLPQNVNTPIGEKGVRLSGGQRQRIGIARALYRQPEILIFDEATAALDNNTEVEVNRAIKSLQNNVTIILVAHRLQTIQQADYIYVLDKGKIADEGTFEQLQNQSPIFQKITQTVKN